MFINIGSTVFFSYMFVFKLSGRQTMCLPNNPPQTFILKILSAFEYLIVYPSRGCENQKVKQLAMTFFST